MGKDLTEIAAMLIGVALVTLLITRASQTSQVISSATTGFNSLLQTVSGQGGSAFGPGSL